jgi:hypothetical protein
MQSVFVAGSIKVRSLPVAFVGRLEKLIASGLMVMVGDANGADRAIQQVLLDRRAPHVTVYCTGDVPRNNIGDWAVESIPSEAPPGTRRYFAAKDVAMASAADFGLMLWDAKSTGTLSNVIELTKRQKPSVVFVTTDARFFVVRDWQGLTDLVSRMSSKAKSDADAKIGLSAKLEAMSTEQLGFPI